MFSRDTTKMESILSITNSVQIIVRADSKKESLNFAQSAVKPLSKEEVLWHGTSPRRIANSEETLNLNRLKSNCLISKIRKVK